MKSLRRLLLFLGLLWSVSLAVANVEKMKCPMGRDYDLYLPEKIDLNRTYWLVCYIHGAHGAACDNVPSLKHFVERGDCIGIAPSFAHGFQLLKNGTDEQLIGILDQLSKKYHLHPKMFVYGHSAGGQFSHRFTLRHSDLIIGCESCSSGTWATGGFYQSLNVAAKNIPIAIACGDEDKGKKGAVIARLAFSNSGDSCAMSQNPGWNRIEWLKQFQRQLEKENFFFKEKVFEGEGHDIEEREQEALAVESFLLATCGMLPEERTMYDDAIATIKKNKIAGRKDLVTSGLQSLEQNIETRSKTRLRSMLLSQGWHPSEAALDQCLKASKEFVYEEMKLLKRR